MAELVLVDMIIYFILFSFCGWVCETVFCSVGERRFVYRGFLNGPICPVYGFGGLIVVYLLAPFRENIIILFIMGMISTTVLEYFTSYILEKLFHQKWWDYSHRKFNINGRVCLPYSLMFGGLSVVAVKLLYPPFSNFVENVIPYKGKPYIAGTLLLILSVDLAATVTSLLRENGKTAELVARMEEFKIKVESKLERKAEERVEGKLVLAQQWDEFKSSLQVKPKGSWITFLDNLGKKVENRLKRSYPNREISKDKNYIENFKNWLEAHSVSIGADKSEEGEEE